MTTVYVKTDDGNITVVNDGETYIVTPEHPNYQEIVYALGLSKHPRA